MLGFLKQDIERPDCEHARGNNASKVFDGSSRDSCRFQKENYGDISCGNHKSADNPSFHVLDDGCHGSADTAFHVVPPSKLQILKETLSDRFLLALLSFIAGVQFAIFIIGRGL